MKKLVHSVGINDANYKTSKYERIEGKQKLMWRCPFYTKWVSMIQRCYSVKHQERLPTYKGCVVVEDWKTFSNFRSWMINQDWEGNDLDKDILIKNNKVYSPETCVFIPQTVNKFLLDSGASRGNYPIGVSFNKKDGKFHSHCCNPFTKKYEYLGCFTCSNEAHLAWKSRKQKLALELADSVYVGDPRVKLALKTRYI